MGKLIAIDGLDGSGKETQSALLCDYLRSRGAKVRYLSFPMYDCESSVPVKMYLGGKLGQDPAETNAFAASMLFATDRYLTYRTDWARDVRDPDTVVVTNRYTTANAVHQLSKLPREEWDAFLEWLFDFEFGKLALPAPDEVIYLEMPPHRSAELIRRRSGETGREMDIHELDKSHLENSYRAALYASEKLGWHRISCATDESILSREEIFGKILEALGL